MSDLTQQLSPNHLYFPSATSSSQGYCLVGVGGAAGVDDIHTSDLANLPGYEEKYLSPFE